MTRGIVDTPLLDFKNDLFERRNVRMLVMFTTTRVISISYIVCKFDRPFTTPFSVNMQSPSKYILSPVQPLTFV